MLKISKRSLIPPFIVMDVMRAANERAASGSDVLHLEVGQPSSPAPKKVIETAQFVLANDKLGYTDALGISLLREKISGHYRVTYGVNLDPKRIVITSGSSGGLLLSFLSSFDVGDCVGMATPGYPAYKNMLKSSGVKVVEIPVDSKSHFQLNPEVLDKLSENLDGLIISSPSNPTGSMISSSGMRDLVDWCDRRGTRLISDEIYHGIVYGEQASTALSYGTDVIIINSFSKYFSMYTSLFEKYLKASCLAKESKLSNSFSFLTSFIPFPPPPADALIRTGYPILDEIFFASSAV